MKEYQINVIAGTKLISDLVETVKDATYNATTDIKPVPPGPLPDLTTGGVEKKMDVGSGIWTWKGVVLKNPLGTDGIPEGYNGSLWFDKVNWSISKVQELKMAEGTPKIEADKIPSGAAVIDYSVGKNDIKYLGDIFDKKNVVFGEYVNGSGLVQPSEKTSYGVVYLNDHTSNKLTLFLEGGLGGNGKRAIFQNSENQNIGSVIDTGSGVSKHIFTIPTGADKLLFTIDVQNATRPMDLFKIHALIGVNDKKIIQILDFPLIASEILENDKNKEFVKLNGNITRSENYRYNLINPTNARLNSTYSSTKGYVYSATYNASEPIPIKQNIDYYFNTITGINKPVRSVRLTNETGAIVEEFTTAMNSFKCSKQDSKYAVVVFYNNIEPADISMSTINEGFKEYSGDDEFIFETEKKQNAKTPNSVITLEVLENELANLDISKNIKINVSNSDKILFVGSSSVESYYSPNYKAWVNKLQDFLDWQIVPYGWGGQDGNSIATKFQLDIPARVAQGVKPSEINPTYVFIGQTLNSDSLIDDPYDTAFVESNENLLRSAVSITGAKPMIGTMYRTENRPWIENSLKQMANKWGADFVPVGTYHMSMIRTEKFAGFYGRAHPAIRTSEAYTLPLLGYFNQLPRPKQSILLFEARNQDANVSDLAYKDNYKRAEKFRSIQVGEVALGANSQEMYDRLNESEDYTIDGDNVSQYMQLLKKKSIQLGNRVLIEIIVPKVRTELISVDLISDNITNTYLFNCYSQQFESVNLLEITDKKYVEFDKVKILLVGESISISDINVNVKGGDDKPKQNYNRVEPPKSGVTVIKSQGFDSANIGGWNIGGNSTFNLTTKYGDSIFNDMPRYLGESKDVIQLTGALKRNITLDGIESFGYRKLRIWTCARLYPKIYNPNAFASWNSANENPYTNISWYGQNKYDYDDLNIILRYKGVTYENQCKSINIQKVGLFWNLGYVDVEIPVARNGVFELDISRGSNINDYPMQICDVSVEII